MKKTTWYAAIAVAALAAGIAGAAEDGKSTAGAGLRQEGRALSAELQTKLDAASIYTDAEIEAFGDQIDDGLCGLGDEGELLVGGVAQRVTAEGDDDSFAHDDYLSLIF